MTTAEAIAPRHRTAERPPRRWFGSAAVTVLGLLLAVVAVAVVSGRYQVRPVLSGSMRPGLAVGGVVVTKRIPLDDVRVRDVIVFHRPDRPAELVVHRVISLVRSGTTVSVKTQGDNNSAPDPWTVDLQGASAYRAVFSVPLLGYPAVWMHSAHGQRELLLLAGLVIAMITGSMWRAERRKTDEGDDPDVAPDGNATVDGADPADAAPVAEPSATTVLDLPDDVDAGRVPVGASSGSGSRRRVRTRTGSGQLGEGYVTLTRAPSGPRFGS